MIIHNNREIGKRFYNGKEIGKVIRNDKVIFKSSFFRWITETSFTVTSPSQLVKLEYDSSEKITVTKKGRADYINITDNHVSMYFEKNYSESNIYSIVEFNTPDGDKKINIKQPPESPYFYWIGGDYITIKNTSSIAVRYRTNRETDLVSHTYGIKKVRPYSGIVLEVTLHDSIYTPVEGRIESFTLSTAVGNKTYTIKIMR